MHKTIKIGILGPKPYPSLDGHDKSNPIRLSKINNIKRILSDIISKDQNNAYLGLTGLSLGIEQDFAHICIDLNIDYHVYLSHENITSQWGSLPVEITKDYQYLLDHALEVKNIGKTTYTPKKIINRKMKIYYDSDILIHVKSKFDKLIDNILEENKEYNKTIYHV